MHNVFEITNKYIVLATVLILYSLITGVYLAVAAHGALINILFALIIFILMSAVFMAGWFNMIKTSVLEPDKEDPNTLIKEFLPGAGEYFLPGLGTIFNLLLISLAFFVITAIIGMKFIGDPGISTDALTKAMQNQEALKAFVSSLTEQQYLKISLWNLLLLANITLNCFVVILYLPAIFFKNKNPFIALFISLKDLFSRKFFKTFGIFLLIFVVNFVISILLALFAGNSFIHFLLTLTNFYFMTFASVGVFYYYYHNFVKSHLGQNIDKRI